jgi:hypothetical protein
MNTRADGAGLLPVGDDETRGHAIKRRRELLGIFTAREFERATERVGAKVPRASIANAESGVASDRIYVALETALDRLEEETGQNDQSSSGGNLKFTLHNVYGIGEVIAEGPPEARDEIVESLAKLLRDIRNDSQD